CVEPGNVVLDSAIDRVEIPADNNPAVRLEGERLGRLLGPSQPIEKGIVQRSVSIKPREVRASDTVHGRKPAADQNLSIVLNSHRREPENAPQHGEKRGAKGAMGI